MKKAMTSKELKLFWNEFSNSYVNKMEYELLPSYITLFNISNMKNVSSEDKLLELSVGGGYGFKFLIENTKSNQIFGGDISEEMITITNERISTINTINPSKQVKINIIDNENLSLFNNNSIDKIISGMSLHLVNSPERMIQESFRILTKKKNSSSVAFSVWGRPENNFLFTFVPNILRKYIDLPLIRSNFHLSSKEKLNFLMKNAGFRNIYIDFVGFPSGFSTIEDMETVVNSPLYVRLIENIKEKDLKERIRIELRSCFEEEIKNKGRIQIESMVIYASV